MHWYYGNWNCGSSRSSRSINSTMSIGEHLITHSDGKANPVENRLKSMNSCCSHKSRNSFQRSYQIFFLTRFHQVFCPHRILLHNQPCSFERRLIFWSLVEVSLHSVWSPSFPFPNSQWWLFSKQGVGGGSLWSPIVFSHKIRPFLCLPFRHSFKDQDHHSPQLWGHVCMKLLSRHSRRFVPWTNLSYVDFHPLQKPASAIQVCVHQFSARWLLSSPPLLFFCLYFVWRPSQTCLWIIIWAKLYYTSLSLEFWDIFATKFCLAPWIIIWSNWVTRLPALQTTKKAVKAKFILVYLSVPLKCKWVIFFDKPLHWPPKDPWLLSFYSRLQLWLKIAHKVLDYHRCKVECKFTRSPALQATKIARQIKLIFVNWIWLFLWDWK